MQTSTQTKALQAYYRFDRGSVVDSASDLDLPMQTVFKQCVTDHHRYAAISLTISANYKNADREYLKKSMLVLNDRISQKYLGCFARDKKNKAGSKLQCLFVLESPMHKHNSVRQRVGDFHRHIHGFIEMPKNVSMNDFSKSVLSIWSKSQFSAEQNVISEATEIAGWVDYCSKRGTLNIETNKLVNNYLLYENLRAPSLLR